MVAQGGDRLPTTSGGAVCVSQRIKLDGNPAGYDTHDHGRANCGGGLRLDYRIRISAPGPARIAQFKG